RVPTRRRSQNDSKSTCSRASVAPSTSCAWSGADGQHGSPSTSTSGRYSPPRISAWTSKARLSTCGAPSSQRMPTFSSRLEDGEPHAAPPQDLVERREHDVAHAGLHAPEERAAVGEERAQHAAQRLPGGDARTARIGVRVREAEVVEPA